MKAASHALIYNLIHELKINKIVNIKACDLMPAIVNTKEAAKWLDTAEKKAMAVQPEAIAAWIIENVDNDHIESEKLFLSKLVL
jgi:short-subunit dehydrogenase involved in D-alanine esterification of teichoic acids